MVYLRRCYINNDLSQGRIKMGGVTLDLSKVTIPIYHLAAREDHIAPARSVFSGAQFFGGPVRFVVAGSGHIAGVVNAPSRDRYQYWTGGPPVGEFETWLKPRRSIPAHGGWIGEPGARRRTGGRSRPGRLAEASSPPSRMRRAAMFV